MIKDKKSLNNEELTEVSGVHLVCMKSILIKD